MDVLIHKTEEPAGAGIGPLLEVRDSLKVLEQTEDRPLMLEELALDLSSKLLELSLEDSPKEIKESYEKRYKNTREWAKDVLSSGKAHGKLLEIIEAQGGNSRIRSSDLKPGKYCFILEAGFNGKVTKIMSKNITAIARILGAPKDKKAGMVLHKKIDQEIKKGDRLVALYSDSEYRLSEAQDTLDAFPIFEIA